MRAVLISFLAMVRGVVRSRVALHLEVLALRHQVQVLQRSHSGRLRLAHADRWLWAWLSHVWRGWRTALVIVKPDTVVAWHRKGGFGCSGRGQVVDARADRPSPQMRVR